MLRITLTSHDTMIFFGIGESASRCDGAAMGAAKVHAVIKSVANLLRCKIVNLTIVVGTYNVATAEEFPDGKL